MSISTLNFSWLDQLSPMNLVIHRAGYLWSTLIVSVSQRQDVRGGTDGEGREGGQFGGFVVLVTFTIVL